MTTTNSAQRDELADEIAGHPIGSGHYSTSVGMDEARDIADAILAAGYRKPRTITTVEELDALPEDTRVWGSSPQHPNTPGTGWPYEKQEAGEWWNIANDWIDTAASDIRLPAVIVWEPEAEEAA